MSTCTTTTCSKFGNNSSITDLSLVEAWSNSFSSSLNCIDFQRDHLLMKRKQAMVRRATSCGALAALGEQQQPQPQQPPRRRRKNQRVKRASSTPQHYNKLQLKNLGRWESEAIKQDKTPTRWTRGRSTEEEETAATTTTITTATTLVVSPAITTTKSNTSPTTARTDRPEFCRWDSDESLGKGTHLSTRNKMTPRRPSRSKSPPKPPSRKLSFEMARAG